MKVTANVMIDSVRQGTSLRAWAGRSSNIQVEAGVILLPLAGDCSAKS